MNNDADITAAHAETIMHLAARLTETMNAAGRTCPDLTWLNMVMAAGVACRGVAAVVMASSPDLTLDQVRIAMMREFASVMALPAELVRTLRTDDDEAPEVTVLPVKRH